MTVKEKVAAQAARLAWELEEKEQGLLEVLCDAAVSALKGRLREGLTAEDCGEDFVLGASLYAVAALHSAAETLPIQEFRAGDLTVKQGEGSRRDAIARNLKEQAEEVMRPYFQDCFRFAGV